jgi:hypothetical protein
MLLIEDDKGHKSNLIANNIFYQTGDGRDDGNVRQN